MVGSTAAAKPGARHIRVGLEGPGPSLRRKPIVVRRPCFRATVMIEPTLIRDE